MMRSLARRLSRRIVARLAGFRDCRDATVLIEFATTLPIMLALVIGTAETNRYLIAKQHFQNTHSTIARIVSQLGDPTLNTTTFQPSDWQKQMQFVALLMPEVLDGTETARDWWTPHGVSLTISWVVMSLVSGTYHAHVAWSLSNDVNALRTACNGKTLSFQQDDAPFDIDKLPVSLRADGSAIVVDLKFEHQLTFTDRFLWPTSFQSSSYFAPRNVDKILFQDGPVSSDFVAPQKSVCAAFNQ